MPYDSERHGPQRVVGPGFHRRVFALVRKVPAGRVTTYGDIAKALGLSTAARHVGFALAALGRSGEDESVPWHRVVNGRGRLSTAGSANAQDSEQALRLKEEGVLVLPTGQISEFRTRRLSSF